MMMKYKYLYFLSSSHIAQMKPTLQSLTQSQRPLPVLFVPKVRIIRQFLFLTQAQVYIAVSNCTIDIIYFYYIYGNLNARCKG